MNHRTVKPLLADALDTLLSLTSSPTRHAIALSQIEAVVAPLALDPHLNLFNAFLKSQDSIEHNLVSGLLEWLGRTLIRFGSFKGSDADKVRENMSRCLTLVQGLLLLHRPSQRLFARKSSLEYLVAVVELSRTSGKMMPATPQASPHASPLPSPLLFPTSPAFHHQPDPLQPPKPDAISSNDAHQLAIAALDTLLCALVDRPKNMRAFEESGGLESIVKVLKDRNVAQPVRIKIIEILYYYLLPETSLGASTSTAPSSTYSAGSFASSADSMSTAFTHSQLPDMLANAAYDFVPQTPTKPKPASSHHRSRSTSDNEKWGSDRAAPPATPSSSSSSRDPSPSRTPQRPRGLRHKRSQSLLHFPTQPAPPVPASPRVFSQSVSAPTSDSESTPRPRFMRSTRNPLQPIPGSPDLSRPRSSHRRSQSTSAASVPNSPNPTNVMSPSRPSPRIPTTRREDRESAMLPPPVPLSRSTSTRLPPPSHRRSSSSSSSSSATRHAPLARSSSLSTPTTTPRLASTPRPIPPPSPALLQPPPSPSLSSFSGSSSPRRCHRASKQQHVRSGAEKKELLGKIIGNVDALEQRFKMMGLGLSGTR
ncbi:hypothetical protein JCM16303_001680 [Sporobolomyces ruberrimus]